MSYPKKNISSENKNRTEEGTLYIVPTPIGNLSDITQRALKVLSEVDFIAAEDTRNTGLLLSRYGISKPMISYFEHNRRERGEIIVQRLAAGESCALVSDAGTPAVSDPGEDLVRLCSNKGIPVTALPGACAAVCALTLSALPTGRFAFEGFLSVNKNERKARLESLINDPHTLNFYEAPHKLKGTLADLLEILGDRKTAVCRELTKLNEEVLRTTLSGAISHFEETPPRGEFVLIVEGFAGESEKPKNYPENPAEHVRAYLVSGMKRMEAIKAAAADRGISKREMYSMLLEEENQE